MPQIKHEDGVPITNTNSTVVLHNNMTYKDYQTNIDLWQRLDTAMIGGMEYTKKVLKRYHKESQAKYDARCARAICFNVLKQLIQTRTSHLKHGKIIVHIKDVDSANAMNIDKKIASIIKNMDGRGSDIRSITSQCHEINGPDGTVMVMVQTKKELNNGQPYLTLFHPKYVINYQVDDVGNFIWILLEQEDSEQVLDDTLPILRKRDRPKYILYRKDRIEYLDKNGNIQPGLTKPNELGYIPIWAIPFIKVPDTIFGISLIADIESINKAMIRTLSQIDEQNAAQTFGQLVVEGLSDKYDVEEGTGYLKPKTVTVGADEVIKPEAGNKAYYISPDASQGQQLINSFHLFMEIALYLAQLRKGSTTSTGSGLSKAEDFIDTDRSLVDTCDDIAIVLAKVLNCCADILNIKERYIVKGPDDYGIQSYDAYVNILRSIQLLDIPGSVKAAFLKQICQQTLKNLSEAELEQLMDDITKNMNNSNREIEGLPNKNTGIINDRENINNSKLINSGNGKEPLQIEGK